MADGNGGGEGKSSISLAPASEELGQLGLIVALLKVGPK